MNNNQSNAIRTEVLHGIRDNLFLFYYKTPQCCFAGIVVREINLEQLKKAKSYALTTSRPYLNDRRASVIDFLDHLGIQEYNIQAVKAEGAPGLIFLYDENPANFYMHFQQFVHNKINMSENIIQPCPQTDVCDVDNLQQKEEHRHGVSIVNKTISAIFKKTRSLSSIRTVVFKQNGHREKKAEKIFNSNITTKKIISIEASVNRKKRKRLDNEVKEENLSAPPRKKRKTNSHNDKDQSHYMEYSYSLNDEFFTLAEIGREMTTQAQEKISFIQQQLRWQESAIEKLNVFLNKHLDKKVAGTQVRLSLVNIAHILESLKTLKGGAQEEQKTIKEQYPNLIIPIINEVMELAETYRILLEKVKKCKIEKNHSNAQLLQNQSTVVSGFFKEIRRSNANSHSPNCHWHFKK
jgi:hypothetical protein